MGYPTYQTMALGALQDLYNKAASVLPGLIAATIVLIIGWLLGVFLSRLVRKILEAVKIDQLANQLGLKSLSQKVDKKLSVAALGGWIIKWFFFLGSFLAVADILGFDNISAFLYQGVLAYAGHVLAAMAILLLGILSAKFFSALVTGTVKAGGLQGAEALGAITRWAIMIFTAIAAISQLQIATDFLQDLFRALIIMLAIAGGLAFGLGGKDHAKKVLDSIEAALKG